jgi:tight adherence protein C
MDSLFSLFGSGLGAQTLIVPIAGAALLVGGALLVASSIRTRGELLARRLELIEFWAAAAPAAAPTEESAQFRARPSQQQHLFRRAPTHGLTEAQERDIARRLAKLNLRAEHAARFFSILRLVSGAIFGLLIALWALGQPYLGIAPLPLVMGAFAGLLGWYLPVMMINFALKRRAKIVSEGFPDALELLVVCVEAGLSLEDGLDRVIRELRRSQSALAEELAITSADLKILPNRDQALANLGERIDVPSVKSVIATLSQSLQYGSPLARALRVVAAEMRNDFLVQLEERANRLPTLLTLPVILFILPTLFLILGGPAALKLIDVFQQTFQH